jgi:hypothetical protein
MNGSKNSTLLLHKKVMCMAIKITIIIFLIFGSFAVDEWLKKRYDIKDKKGWLYKPVNTLHKWLQRALLAGWFIFIFVAAKLNLSLGSFIVLWFFVLINSLRVYMEWKYERESNRYILSLGSVVLMLIILMIIYI